MVGQEHVTKTLAEALKQGRISHAYLFTGPRGVGKTSIARIMAHEINDLPYDDDSAHMDIIEIDAASNRRIDEIRELRDKVFIAPTSAKYKVYIIDEVHMLTREAFNALLKTLEEPPEHVVFILATTDAHKLPETIISRTQRFNFKPGEQTKMADLLAGLAKKEGIKVSPEALDLLVEHADGSFRDSVSLLDQASSHGKSVDAADVRQLLGLPPSESLQKLLQLVAGEGDSATIMQALDNLYQQGYRASMIAKQLGKMIREDVSGGTGAFDMRIALGLMGKLLEVPASRDPERLLEVVLLSTIPAQVSGVSPKTAPSKVAIPPLPATAAKPAKKAESEQKTANPDTSKSQDRPPSQKESDPPKNTKVKSSDKTKEGPSEAIELDEAAWKKILADLKTKHNTLYGLIRMAQPEFNQGGVTLKFAFAFHQKRLSEPANHQRLQASIQGLTGQDVHITCVLDESVKPPAPEVSKAAASAPPEELSTISNIFGGGELLES